MLLSDWSILNNKFLEPFDLAVVGGGAAGFMTAITAAENGVKRIHKSESKSPVSTELVIWNYFFSYFLKKFILNRFFISRIQTL